MWGNAAEGLMLAGGGIVIGSWFAMWLEPRSRKMNLIRVGICGVITVCLFIFIVKVGVLLPLLMVAEWPVIGVIVVAIIAYSIFVAVFEPVWIGLNNKFNQSLGGIKETFNDVAKEYERHEREKKSNDSVDEYFNEWASEREDKRREPRVGDRNLSEDLMDAGKAYIAKEQLMTPSEQFAYKVIEHKYKDRFHIFAQVRVVDIIKPNPALYRKNSKEFNSLFRQLSQWHFDFVLCYREDFGICCVIELDDPSHGRKARQKRDRILNRACEVAGVRIERMRLNFESKMVERI